MTDWTRRFSSSFRFMRVSRKTGLEVGAVHGVLTGGTIERNQDSDYETGSVGFHGDALSGMGSDLLRCYLDATFMDGSKVSEALGTFVVSVPKVNRAGPVTTGTASLSGRLCEASEDEFDAPVTVAKGTNAVAEAASLLRAAGLTVLVKDQSSYAITTPWVLGTDSSDQKLSTRLLAVNALLDAAGFAHATCDPYGRAVLRRYVEPSKRSPALSMTEGVLARFESSCTDERDASGVANVVHTRYSTSDKTVIGTAVDSDPSNPYSTASRGWRKCASYTYSDMPSGSTDAEMQAAANAKAAELLRNQQSVIHRVTVRHVYAPVTVGDAVDVHWPTAGILGRFAIRRMVLTMTGGCPMEIELRRYER